MISKKEKTDANWFNKARYGLFIHWGAYSVGGRGEWFMNRELITKDEYTKSYVEKWKAESYRPEEWLQLAKAAGMRYAVLTARHHDGFALWDSKTNDFNAANLGPKRDLVAPYVEACRSAGLKVGIYYSPASWTHADYPGAFFRDWPSATDWKSEKARKNFIEFYRSELRELLSNYGKIDYLWFDGCIPGDLEGDETLKMVRTLQPEIIVNNRLGAPFDVHSCEQTINPPNDPTLDWEACMTLNQNWGYHAGDSRWKNKLDVIELLLKCAESAGNLLLNIGPKPDGSIPTESVEIMSRAGEWINNNFNAISNSEHHPFSWNCTARPVTSVGNTVFLHFLVDPHGSFCWGELKNRVLNAYFNDSAEKIRFHQENDRLFLTDIPNPLPSLPATIALELDGKPESTRRQTTFWIPE